MRYQIETRPAQQPAVCSMLGVHEDEWFIRISASDAHWGTFLLSKTAIEEICKERGYVKKTRRVELLEELRQTQNDLGPYISMLLTELGKLSTVSTLLETVSTFTENIAGITERISAEIQSKQSGSKPNSQPSIQQSDGTSE